jgi:hypothetical protein
MEHTNYFPFGKTQNEKVVAIKWVKRKQLKWEQILKGQIWANKREWTPRTLHTSRSVPIHQLFFMNLYQLVLKKDRAGQETQVCPL